MQSLQRWQCYIEEQPLRFIDRELIPNLQHILTAFAEFMHCESNELVLIPNTTTGIDVLLRTIPLTSHDTVVSFEFGYEPVKHLIRRTCDVTGADQVEVFVALPIKDPCILVDSLRSTLEDLRKHRKRVAFVLLEHITSSGGVVLPIKEVVQLCHDFETKVVVDGAHALGAMDINLHSLNCEFYVMNAHKWFCSAKGCALLYIRKDVIGTLPSP
uniref:Isopenicillin N epimerase n=1 Tax=Lygus hesperus TaxID=30085 RepID=A0A0A9WU66_LYGHE